MTRLTLVLFVTIPLPLVIGIGGALLTDNPRTIVLVAFVVGAAAWFLADDPQLANKRGASWGTVVRDENVDLGVSVERAEPWPLPTP